MISNFIKKKNNIKKNYSAELEFAKLYKSIKLCNIKNFKDQIPENGVHGKLSFTNNNCNRSTTLLTSKYFYNKIPIRFMFRPVFVQHKVLHKTLFANYSTNKAMKFKPKKDASKDLATDDSGIHTMRMNIKCEEEDCEKKKCVTLCGKLKSMETDGFFTHKPIPGKYCRHISDKDANQNQDSQYYVKNKDKTKQVDAKKLASYKKNEVKEDSKFDTFMQNNNDKFYD